MCDTGKWGYLRAEDAIREARRCAAMRGVKLCFYKCQKCRRFHLTKSERGWRAA